MLTVAKLIAILQTQPQDAPVIFYAGLSGEPSYRVTDVTYVSEPGQGLEDAHGEVPPPSTVLITRLED